jgi:hypothetical protein
VLRVCRELKEDLYRAALSRGVPRRGVLVIWAPAGAQAGTSRRLCLMALTSEANVGTDVRPRLTACACAFPNWLSDIQKNLSGSEDHSP